MAVEECSANQPQEIDMVTLGMFIIDDIYYPPPRPAAKDVLGGAGSYAALGARIFSPPPRSRSVGWIVDVGRDFPPHIGEQIEEWQTSCLLRQTPWRRTTRGRNEFMANEERLFEYLTPKLRLDEDSLSAQLLSSKSFHLICSPLRCVDLIQNILKRRSEEFSISLPHPIWVWEPVPYDCTTSKMDEFLKALKVVDVVSPNHTELCNIFGKKAHDSAGNVLRDSIESCCKYWVNSGIGADGKGAIVIRAGREGCCVTTLDHGPAWLPAYHRDSSKVVDPTGGGNTFVGAVAVILARQIRDVSRTFENVKEASIVGSVAASYAIEQVGLPRLEAGTTVKQETWNGENAWQRLDELRTRMHDKLPS